MNEKMTYKQALIRSLILGLIFNGSMFINLLLGSDSLYGLRELIILKINGCWLWFYFLCGHAYLNMIVVVVSPMIVSLLLGSVVFLLFRNKKWLTPWNFTFILLATYLVVNVGASMLADSCLA